MNKQNLSIICIVKKTSKPYRIVSATIGVPYGSRTCLFSNQDLNQVVLKSMSFTALLINKSRILMLKIDAILSCTNMHSYASLGIAFWYIVRSISTKMSLCVKNLSIFKEGGFCG